MWEGSTKKDELERRKTNVFFHEWRGCIHRKSQGVFKKLLEVMSECDQIVIY